MDKRVGELIEQAKLKGLSIVGYKELKETVDEVLKIKYILEFEDGED